MTKNRSMRIAVLVLALALITCCFVGTTFAKYASEATGSASVTIAKWAFTSGSADIIDADDLAIDLAATILDTDTDEVDQDVNAGKIAPGTYGSGTYVITNESDVTANIKLDLTVPTNLQFLGFEKTAKVGTGVAAELTAAGVNVPAGETVTITVSWEWAFDTVDPVGQNDVRDTDLGVAADGTATTIPVTFTFTQVD